MLLTNYAMELAIDWSRYCAMSDSIRQTIFGHVNFYLHVLTL